MSDKGPAEIFSGIFAEGGNFFRLPSVSPGKRSILPEAPTLTKERKIIYEIFCEADRSALCAAVLCVPALAAASATGAGAYVPNPQYTVISGTVAHQKDGGLLMSTSTGEPTEDYILWTEGVMILDAVSGEPVDAKSIKDGSTVYAWLGAQTAVVTASPPQQVTPELLLVNVPADYKVPQYDVIVRSDGLTGLGIPNRSGMSVTLSDGMVYQVW